MEMVKPLLGATLLKSTLECDNDKVRAFASKKGSDRFVVTVNGTERPVVIQMKSGRARREWLLTGPAIDAKEGVSLAERPANGWRKGVLHVPAYSAALLEA